MKSITKQRKLRLGKKTDAGYDFSSKIDLKEDFTKQLEKVMMEKRANDKLEIELKKLQKEIELLPKYKKEKNLDYYFIIGKKLLFIDKAFQEISPYSIYRRIVEEIPQILPFVKKEVVPKHLDIMHNLAYINKSFIHKANWDQWYEILKFKNLYKDKEKLKKILRAIKGKKTSGPRLREIIHANK